MSARSSRPLTHRVENDGGKGHQRETCGNLGASSLGRQSLWGNPKGGELTIHLAEDEAAAFGVVNISAHGLAAYTLAYWKNHDSVKRARGD